MGLLGLLEPADPEPVSAGVFVHVDVITLEIQAVCAGASQWVSRGRPIAAEDANAVQPTIAVGTQGEQVEIFVCIGCRRETGVGDTTIAVDVVLERCTHVG